MHLVAIADQIALRRHAIDRRTNHQERPIELPAVERDEARVGVEPLPEFLQDLLFGPGDVSSQSSALDADVRLSRHFVQRARTAVVNANDADCDDLSAERRQAAGALGLLGAVFGLPLDQILADVRIVLFPGNADSLDIDDEFFHGRMDDFRPRFSACRRVP